MVPTKHFRSRMSQRGIDKLLVEATCLWGSRDYQNRILLNMKMIDERLALLDAEKQVLLRARKKGSIIVVEENGCLLTTYSGGRKNRGNRRGK